MEAVADLEGALGAMLPIPYDFLSIFFQQERPKNEPIQPQTKFKRCF
jgi:hypothetical protein